MDKDPLHSDQILSTHTIHPPGIDVLHELGVGSAVRQEAPPSRTSAIALEDELEYDEPEPLPLAARHWLGAALLEAERYPDAERAYRDELEDHPHNGWSLFGLLAALEAQGKSSPEVEADFIASWARSDTWIRSSRF